MPPKGKGERPMRVSAVRQHAPVADAGAVMGLDSATVRVDGFQKNTADPDCGDQ